MMIRRISGLSACLALTLVAVGCGSDDDDVTSTTPRSAGSTPAADAVDAVDVALTADGCSPETIEAAAGDVTFAVKNDRDDKAEFEILSAAPAILIEKFLEAGASDSYTVTLMAGDYQIICGAPSDTRAELIVTGEGASGTPGSGSGVVDQDDLDTLVSEYAKYIDEQVAELQSGVKDFTDAVRAGDTEQAKELYAPAREPWERIEPVAELFPDSDGVIDSRSDDFEQAEADPEFTGFHALEYGLWANGTIDGATVDLKALADRLDSDIAELVQLVKTLEYQPAIVTNGAAALIEEAAQTKITGEEDRYSKTDLSTFAANVEGAKEIFDLSHDLLEDANPTLVSDVEGSFDDVDELLEKYADGDGYQTYDEVTAADRDKFKTAMAQLSEELSQISGSLGLVVSS